MVTFRNAFTSYTVAANNAEVRFTYELRLT